MTQAMIETTSPMSRRKLARLLGVSESTVSRWLNGNIPRERNWWAIHRALLGPLSRKLMLHQAWKSRNRELWQFDLRKAMIEGVWNDHTS